MQQKDAIDMLSGHFWEESEKQVWADLGCGSGTFTLALAHLLVPDSRIIAVDKNRSSLDKIPDQFNRVTIKKRAADFVEDDFSPGSLYGILMANSLHYVKHQKTFIQKAKQFLKPGGSFLVVEYNTSSSNPWVPYPVSFNRLNELFMAAGFSSIQKIGEKPSRYNPSNLYSARIQ